MSALPTRADLAGTPTRAELQTILLATYDMLAQRLAAGTTGAGTASTAELLLARNSLGLGAGADIASAATLDLTGRTGNIVRITGTTGPVTSVTLANGEDVTCYIVSTPTFTYNVTTMPLPGAANYTASAGDIVRFIKDGSGVITVEIVKKNGTSVASRPASTTQAGESELATDAEVIAGTDTARVPSVSSMRNGLIAIQTPQATTTGTSKEYPSVPSWVKEVDIFFKQTSLSSGTDLAVQLGTAGSYISSGYVGKTATMATGGTGVTALSSGFSMRSAGAATEYVGKMKLSLFDEANHIWMCTTCLSDAQNTAVIQTSGYVQLSARLTRILIYSFDGSSTFDLGSVGCSWR